jgi:hypothetical protein
LQSVKSSSPSVQSYDQDEPVQYWRHFSSFAGYITRVNDERVYSAWEVVLKNVPKYLNPAITQKWGTDPNKAKILSQEGLVGSTTRTAIQGFHKKLYAKRPDDERGVIASKADVLKLFHLGKKSRSPFANRVKPAIYTYVIAVEDNTMRFSETGAPKSATDYYSKHALHANAMSAVRYSGEFHLRPKGGWANFRDSMRDMDVEWEFIIDNSSGTYAPDKELLGNVRKLMMENFPGVVVFALDRMDAALEPSKKACKLYEAKNRRVKKLSQY